MALEAIVARKREEVARIKAQGGAPNPSGLAPSARSLEAALLRDRATFILECKRMSPSRGLLRADYDAAAIARGYAPWADAISVLADETFFGGSLRDVAAVSEAVSLPVLCKDVVVDPVQVACARANGANAVLLMLSVLDGEGYAACAEAAARLGMDVVVEVRDARELARAVETGARIIGINNRDLATLRVDPGATERLAPLVPQDRIVLSESGIMGREGLRRLEGLVDGYLVGTHLMESADPGRAARALIRGRLKICGITSPEAAALAAAAGATYGGLNFAPGSSRRVEEGAAKRIAAAALLEWVGVFVDAREEEIVRAAERFGLAAVQLHGDEKEDEVAALRDRLGGRCEVWKAHRVKDALPGIETTRADRVLLDGYDAAALGGTGRRFDWSLLARRALDRVVLAGGIDASCARRAEETGAFALDVCTGAETRPGVTCARALERLFAALAIAKRRSTC